MSTAIKGTDTIYQNFAMNLAKEISSLYKDEMLRIGFEEVIYEFDSSTIE